MMKARVLVFAGVAAMALASCQKSVSPAENPDAGLRIESNPVELTLTATMGGPGTKVEYSDVSNVLSVCPLKCRADSGGLRLEHIIAQDLVGVVKGEQRNLVTPAVRSDHGPVREHQFRQGGREPGLSQFRHKGEDEGQRHEQYHRRASSF